MSLYLTEPIPAKRLLMARYLLRLLLFVFFVSTGSLFTHACYGKNSLLPPPAIQDSVIQLRKFDPAHLQTYATDDSYLYDREMKQTYAPSLWSRFINWLFEKILRFVFTKNSLPYWKWGLYIGCALVIGYVILKLTNTDIRGIFFGKAKNQKFQVTEGDENIHLLDFDALITEAVQKEQFSRAVRLFYLKILKQLSERDFINWQQGKTNHEYMQELKRPDISPGFSKLTSLFEYICYGDFPIDSQVFEQTRQEFKDFEEKVKRAY